MSKHEPRFTFSKCPDFLRVFIFNWSPILKPDESISISLWGWIHPDLSSEGEVRNASRTAIFLVGGVMDKTYKMSNHIVTNQGREITRNIRIHITDEYRESQMQELVDMAFGADEENTR